MFGMRCAETTMPVEPVSITMLNGGPPNDTRSIGKRVMSSSAPAALT